MQFRDAVGPDRSRLVHFDNVRLSGGISERPAGLDRVLDMLAEPQEMPPCRGLRRWTCGYRWRNARRRWRALFCDSWSSCILLAEAKEVVAVAVLARDRLGDGAQRLVDVAFELEALRQHLHLQRLAFVLAGDDRAGRAFTRKPAVLQSLNRVPSSDDFAIDSLVRRESAELITMRTNIESGVFTADCGWLIYTTVFAVVAYDNDVLTERS